MATRKKSSRTGTRGDSSRPLTAREKLFAHIVVRPGISQTDAAREAGYLGEDATLATQASRLMRRPKVRELVEKLRGKQLEKISAKAQQVLDELEHVAMARLSRVVRIHPDRTPSVSILPIEEWQEHELAALSEIDVEKIFENVPGEPGPRGGATTVREHVGDLLKLKMKGKLEALTALAKHHKLLVDKVEHEHSGTVYVVDPYGEGAAPPAEDEP